MTSNSDVIVRLQNVHVSISKAAILRSLDLELEQGRIYSIIGRNGAGKTQLLRVIAGLREPDIVEKGCVVVPERVGFVFQKPALFPWMTVIENLLLVAPKARDQIPHYLEKFRLLNYVDRYPYQLSVGTQQKVNVIRAFLNDCKLVLMDEPFSALDLPQKNELIALISEIKRKDTTVLFVTHEIDEALALSGKIFFLSKKDRKVTKSWPVADVPDRSLLGIRKAGWATRLYLDIQLSLEQDEHVSP